MKQKAEMCWREVMAAKQEAWGSRTLVPGNEPRAREHVQAGGRPGAWPGRVWGYSCRMGVQGSLSNASGSFRGLGCFVLHSEEPVI